MTRLDLASLALRGIFALEHAGGKDAFWLGRCLRLVVGAYAAGQLDAVVNGLEVDAHARGFIELHEHHLVDARYRGLDRMPDENIARARREIQAMQPRAKEIA